MFCQMLKKQFQTNPMAHDIFDKMHLLVLFDKGNDVVSIKYPYLNKKESRLRLWEKGT